MASHPYISGPGNIAQAVALLRRNFPATVTSDTIKKFNLASNNESYVINALQFIGAIDSDGKRTEAGQKVFTLHGDSAFQTGFADLVRKAYHDLFDLRGDDAWTMSRAELIGYFRSADKTSEIIGTRQAAVFRVFATTAGFPDPNGAAPTPKKVADRPAKSAKPPVKIRAAIDAAATRDDAKVDHRKSGRDMALTVRVEINLPAGGTKETYDNIFKSIRANLLDD